MYTLQTRVYLKCVFYCYYVIFFKNNFFWEKYFCCIFLLYALTNYALTTNALVHYHTHTHTHIVEVEPIIILASLISSNLYQFRYNIPLLFFWVWTYLQVVYKKYFYLKLSDTKSTKISALIVLYTECCNLLTEAEGSLYVIDVMATLFLGKFVHFYNFYCLLRFRRGEFIFSKEKYK